MDIIALIIVFQALFLFVYVMFARVYFLLSVIFFLLYFLLKYYDYDHEKGSRAWSALRNFTLLGKSVRYYFGNPEEFACENESRKLLFVVMGNRTNMALVNGFGLHGGVFRHLDLAYMLPPLLFRIPLLRDFLLWTGAVAHDEGILLRLLNQGKSVAYAPSGMSGCTESPSDAVFEFAIKHGVSLIPVLVRRELERYAIYEHPWQEFSPPGRWPFPYIFGLRIFGRRPPPLLELSVGVPMEPKAQQNVEDFKRLFMGQVGGLEV